MKQAKLPIHPPIINRKCQFGACQEDLAFVIDGVCSQFGMGFADLLVLTFDGQLYMVEIKDGAKCKSKRRLTPMQKKVALEFGDKFLVAKNGFQAEMICIDGGPRHVFTGINYMEETE